MTVAEAKELVLTLIHQHLSKTHLPIVVDSATPDPSDDGKFSINGKPARVVHHFDGWYIPINLRWFGGSYEQPKVKRGHFHWYVFAIPERRYFRAHYFICDYLQMREWVL